MKLRAAWPILGCGRGLAGPARSKKCVLVRTRFVFRLFLPRFLVCFCARGCDFARVFVFCYVIFFVFVGMCVLCVLCMMCVFVVSSIHAVFFLINSSLLFDVLCPGRR